MARLPEPFKPVEWFSEMPTVEAGNAPSLPVGIPVFNGLTIWRLPSGGYQVGLQATKAEGFIIVIGNDIQATINACFKMRYG